MTSNAPLAGNILILRSAYSAMPCPQIPPALTVASITFEAVKRKGSIEPSGTTTAPTKSGLTDGSIIWASLGSMATASIPDLVQLSMKVF